MGSFPPRSAASLAVLAAVLCLGACTGGAGAPREASPAPPAAARDPEPSVLGLRGPGPETTPPRARRPYEPGEAPVPRALGTPTGSGPTAEDVRTFAEVNRVRGERGLPPFRWNDRLFRAAYDHSLEQHSYGYMGHGSPVAGRDEVGDRLRLAGFAGSTWAEVVAWGYEGPASVVDGWMRSSGHRRILTDPTLREAAFARVGDAFTGNFGVPR